MNNSNPTLRKAHKVLKKIVKKMGNPDLYFSAAVGVDSNKEPTVQTWTGYIAPVREGLEPVFFAAFSKEEFMQKLDDFYREKISQEQIAVVFHEAQIYANERSTAYHKEMIEAIQNPQPVEEALPQGEEAQSSEVVAEGEVVKTEDEAETPKS